MLNRRHLRVKVLQVLYAFFQTANDDLVSGEKELFLNISKTFELYLHQLLLIGEIGYVAKKYFDERNLSNLSQNNDIQSALKFPENCIIKLLHESKSLNRACKDKSISWSNEYDLVRKIFFHIRRSEIYRNYIEKGEHTFEEEKKFVLDIYKTLICNFELLHHYYEEKSIYWIDDWELVYRMSIRTIKDLNEKNDDIKLMDLYKDDSDKKFAGELFNKTVLNHKEFDPMINEKTKNWDIERIALMDIILMKMALTELLKFPEIPVKVTLNEYIELSKMYSTPKSKVFINGVLDKLVEDLEKEGKIKKSGKGLISNTYS